MQTSTQQLESTESDLADPWQPWSPNESEPWNLHRVAHLHRRAGFAGTWQELQRDLAAGHQASIDRFLCGNVYETGVPEDFDSLSKLIGNSAATSDNPVRLQAWWLYRMLSSPDPLSERMALLWHHHFATSITKIKSNALMHQQNHIFRQHGRGEFGDLFSRVIHDPAVLIYLDADLNRKGHPNENLGREIFELFSVGRNHFDESDVTNAARALTGWTVKDNRFAFKKDQHDASEKSIFGKRGNWNGNDVVRLALEHPATANRITFRVCQLLMGENVVDQPLLGDLATSFRKRRMDIDWLLKTILSSKLFFSDANIGSRIRGATEFAIGIIRAISAMIPAPSTLALAEWTTRLGQSLFNPPNVFGFAEGRQWASSQWLISRNRYIDALLEGRIHKATASDNRVDPSQTFAGSFGQPFEKMKTEELLPLLLSSQPKNTTELENSITKIRRQCDGDVKAFLKMTLTLPAANLG